MDTINIEAIQNSIDPLLSPFFEDVKSCDEMIKAGDAPFARRCYVRAVFAFIEAYFYRLRETTLDILTKRIDPTQMVDVHRIVLLLDEIGKVDGTGNLRIEAAKLPSIPYFAFILRTLCELCEFDPQRFFGDNGWRELKLALDVRHRITHPKKKDDADISDDDLLHVCKTMDWVHHCVLQILMQFGKGFPKGEKRSEE